MTTIGYARVSTTDQDLSIQEAALKASRHSISLRGARIRRDSLLGRLIRATGRRALE